MSAWELMMSVRAAGVVALPFGSFGDGGERLAGGGERGVQGDHGGG